jgi:mono/diheme cytochrome c family protein
MAVGSALAAATWWPRPAPPPPDLIDARPNPIPPTPEVLAIGTRVYQTQCASCHGEDGHGDGPQAASLKRRPVDFWVHFGSGHTHSDGRLFFWITDGMPGTEMPRFGDRLSESERWSVIDFVKTFAPVDR